MLPVKRARAAAVALFDRWALLKLPLASLTSTALTQGSGLAEQTQHEGTIDAG